MSMRAGRRALSALPRGLLPLAGLSGRARRGRALAAGPGAVIEAQPHGLGFHFQATAGFPVSRLPTIRLDAGWRGFGPRMVQVSLRVSL